MQSELARLKVIFDQMNSDGFDTSRQLKWGFFFFDSSKTKLNNLYKELKDHDYVLEDLNLMDDHKWRLHVSKKEILTPERLHKRNLAFNDLAEHCDVSLYDGWDVQKL